MATEPCLNEADCIEIEREDLEMQRFSERVIDIIVQALKLATRHIYDHMWGTFYRWASEKGVDPLGPTHRDIVLLFEGWKWGL